MIGACQPGTSNTFSTRKGTANQPSAVSSVVSTNSSLSRQAVFDCSETREEHFLLPEGRRNFTSEARPRPSRRYAVSRAIPDKAPLLICSRCAHMQNLASLAAATSCGRVPFRPG